MDKEEIKKYQVSLGFTNKEKLKEYFDAKEVVRKIDFKYLEKLNDRLAEIITTINNIVVKDIKVKNCEQFIQENIYDVYEYMKEKDLLYKFKNNKQRQLERSYFDWMRGRIVANYFKTAMAKIFRVKEKDIKVIGMDNLENPEAFSKAPTADFEIDNIDGIDYRIEFQCGFQGYNDIKEHKVIEAKKVYKEQKKKTLIVHMDLFRGCVAFVDISNIKESSINWETRTQFEGKTVFHIDDKYFIWKITEPVIEIHEILKELKQINKL